MRTTLYILALAVVVSATLYVPMAALAQGDASAAVPATAEAPMPEVIAAPGVSTSPEAAPQPGTGQDLLVELQAARKALDHYRSRTGPEKQAALFGLLASVTWLLIGLVRRFNDAWPKWWWPKIAAGLGVLAGGFAYLVGGATWPEALLYGFGPPLAVFLHEVLKRPTKAADGGPKPGFVR